MNRIVKLFGLYLLIGIPLFLIVAVNLDRKLLAFLDGLFWHLSVIIFLFLVWRIDIALEKGRKDD